MSDELLLTLLWLIPLLGSVLVLFLPKQAVPVVRWVALGITALTFLLTIHAFFVYVGTDASGLPSLADRAKNNTLQASNMAGELTLSVEPEAAQNDLMVRRAWIPYFNIQYSLGLDGISLSLVLLTGLVSFLACLASWNIDKQVKGYYSLFLLLVASMMGVFLSLDLFLFYVFFEVMLLPMYFLIAVWEVRIGSTRRSSSCSTRCSARSSS